MDESKVGFTLEEAVLLLGDRNALSEMTLEEKKEALAKLQSFRETINGMKAELHSEEDDKPKVLKIEGDRELKRGMALTESLSSSIREYREGLQREREAKYEEMIEEAGEVISPMSRVR